MCFKRELPSMQRLVLINMNLEWILRFHHERKQGAQVQFPFRWGFRHCIVRRVENGIVLRAALAIVMLISGCTPAAPQTRRPPPPMFSPANVDALKGILDLEPADVAALHRRLEANPEDYAARLKLMAYCLRADRASLEASRKQRADLALWLVEHHPDSEILGSPYAAFGANELPAESANRANQLWSAAIQQNPQDAKVFWNAANFYRARDREKYAGYLEKASAFAPENEHYGRELGMVYAQVILGQTPGSADRSIQILDSTGNALVLGAAVQLLQSDYNRSLMMGHENRRAHDLAARYFDRAKVLDPNIDAAWIYPQPDPKMKGMFAPGAAPPTPPAAPATHFRALKPDAFPDLPAGIATLLRARGCLIPQPGMNGPPRNAIRGEFFEKGQTGWAVLCSVRGTSVILAFRNAADPHPAELAKADDQNYVQGDAKGASMYSREINTVDRKFILEHYRAYGGPAPPPIDHQGIDDAFLEKASETYYWYRGQWRKLTGSD